MKIEITQEIPWGKLKKNQNHEETSIEWHPLIMHLIDVMAVAECILNNPIIRNKLFFKIPFTPTKLKRICFLVALHDLGKFNIGFQNKAFPERPHAGHVKEAFSILLDSRLMHFFYEPLGNAIANQWFTTENEDPYEIFDKYLKATICHHGKPLSYEYSINAASLYNQAIINQIIENYKIILNLLNLSLNQEDPDDALPDNEEFIHSFSGLVTLADWIGSGVDYFPFFECEDHQSFHTHLITHAQNRYIFAQKQSALFFHHIGWNLNQQSPHNHAYLQKIITEEKLNQIFNFPALKPFQKDIAQHFKKQEAMIEIIEAQTGDGKTEAALLRFCQYFNAGLVDGLYFALPTRTSATQIYQRIRRIIKNIFPEQTPEVILAIGANAIPQQESLLNYEANTYDDADPLHQKSKSWASQSNKRFLAGTIVVGTIDQILYSQLKIKHSHMRGFALLRHLLVIDEVHSSDTYMLEILKKVLEKQTSFAGLTLLLSATLTQHIKNQLLSQKNNPNQSIEHLKEIPYPLLTQKNHQNQIDLHHLTTFQSKAFEVILQDDFNEDHIAQQVLNFAQQGAKIAVIRNTVSDCIKLQKAVEQRAKEQGQESLLFECQGIICPHHSRFAQQDRRLLDISLENTFSNHRINEGKIIIATQTIQQSLDIDFDVMITDLCPMDILIQRAGRVHRHQNPRATDFQNAKIYVLSPTSFFNDQPLNRLKNHGFGTVYSDFTILESTLKEIQRDPHFIFPQQSRLRIENALNPEKIKEITFTLNPEQQRQFQEHQYEINGNDRAAHIQANRISYRWRDEFMGLSFDDVDDQKISARLGNQEDLQVAFTKPIKTPFHNMISVLNIPSHFIRNLSDSQNNTATIINANDEIIEFEAFHQRFIYSRLGIEKL